MTRAEAIKQIESLFERCKAMMTSDEPVWSQDCEALKVALFALRGPTREQVEKMRGEWIDDGEKVPVDENGCPKDWAKCSACGEYLTASDEYPCTGHFCPNCGAPMTDKAVDMVMERMEEVQNADTGSV